jgi:hypothetical protein
MKLTTISVAAAAMLVFAQSAQAREHYRHHRYHVAHFARHYASARRVDQRRVDQRRGDDAAQNMFAGRRRGYFGQNDFGQNYLGQNYSGHNYPGQNYSDQVYPQRSAYGGPIGAHIGGRPAAWCGWEMRQLVSGDPGPSYNLARNWAHWGQAGPAGVGAVVVWSHHVGKIVGQEGGEWIIESGNDGNRVRTRPRSIAGAIAIRWG